MNAIKHSNVHLNRLSLKVLIVLISVLSLCECLFEDQVSKFDWRKQFVGQLTHLSHPLASSSSPLWRTQNTLIFSTQSAVLTSIYLRNGSIEWRHVLESNVDALTAGNNDCQIMTINGYGNWIRCWTSDGLIVSEFSLPKDFVDSIWQNINDLRLFFHLRADSNKEITVAKFSISKHTVEITKFDVSSQTLKSTATPISTANWFSETTSCDFVSANFLICADSANVVLQYLLIGESLSFTAVPLSSFGLQSSDKPKYLKIQLLPNQHNSERPYLAVDLGGDGFVLLRVSKNQLELVKVLPKVSAITIAPSMESESLAVYILITKSNPTSSEDEADSSPTTGIKISAFNINTWSEIASTSGQFILDNQIFVDKFEIIPLKRGDNKYFKILLSTEDGKLIVTSLAGKISWSREEALSDVVSAEILDLPLSELDAKIEQTFGFDRNNIFSQFITRISTQIYQLQTITANLISQLMSTITQRQSRRKVSDNTEDEFSESVEQIQTETSLVRDEFGLHKIIVTLSSNGKLFGIDTLTGQIIWSIYEPSLHTRNTNSKIPIWVQRTTAHYPYAALCTIVNKNGFIFSFDPITGEALERIKLDVGVSQAMILNDHDSSYLRPLLILDDKLNPIIYPSSAKSLFLQSKHIYYMLYMDQKNNLLRGLNFADSNESELKSKHIWSIDLPPPLSALQVVFKRLNERVHSQGRVMGDRSVLYKYLNPNLVAVAYESIDSQEKPLINLYLVDAITGAIIFATAHKRAKKPIHVVHSENWIIYSYYNEKSRRTEISSIELYEGTTQSNTSAFSSLSRNEILPAIVEQKTYIFPTGIEVMADTLTERGITNKHILIVLPSGGLLELPKAFLDPRRPLNPTPEHREEGLIPYIPELPIPAEGIINYNQSLTKIRGIQTAATNLESTCLVFAYGLDLFYTRVTPSKTFDILKDDFDHLLISAVLIGLISVSYFTKWLAARKSLNSAWK